MSLSLECKKAKRTGFIPAFLCGGILAAAVPIVKSVPKYISDSKAPQYKF